MVTIRLIAGALLLLLGRRLFWLFVGLSGFAVGLLLAPTVLPNSPDWLVLVVALALGIVGALIAVFLQRLAIAVAGFLAGAFVGSTLASALAGDANTVVWVGMIVGGILGAILLSTMFDWGLIGLSAFVGATMIVDSLQLTAGAALTATVVLFLVGIAFQLFTGRKAEPS
jgi:Domain of unknown function (DUF4203)